MKRDIANRKDIEKVIVFFYEKVKKDKVIGFFFTTVLDVNWDKHLPLMCDFWENVLFYTGEYEGNPLVVHRKIHQQHPTGPEHVKRWLQLFDASVNAFYAGPNAEKMKTNARAIAKVMQEKIT